MKITISENVAFVDTPYNQEFVSQIKGIGGARWDSSRREWKIPADCVDQARTIMRRVFGECDLPDESRRVTIKLTFTKEFSRVCAAVDIFGKQVARAFNRDSGAVVGEGVTFIEGKPTSGGSFRYWTTRIPAGAVAILRNVPENVLSEELPEGVIYEIMPEKAVPSREVLLGEKQRLLARIAEIDKLLAEHYGQPSPEARL